MWLMGHIFAWKPQATWFKDIEDKSNTVLSMFLQLVGLIWSSHMCYRAAKGLLLIREF